MISTTKLLYVLDMKLNKKASLEHQSIPLEDKIIALNEAQISLLKKKIDINNLYGLGIDSFKKRYQDLQNLIVQFEKLTVSPTTSDYASFEADLTKTKSKYFLPLDAYVLCTKGNCENKIVTIWKPIKHGDLTTLMFNNFYKPSFEAQETFCLISGNKYIVYTDGTFDVNSLHLTYLRYPVKIDAAGYIDFDGTPSINQDCELPYYLEDELIELAILELAMDTENNPVVQYDAIRSKNSE